MWEKLDALIEDYLDDVKVTDLCVSMLAGNDYVI